MTPHTQRLLPVNRRLPPNSQFEFLRDAHTDANWSFFTLHFAQASEERYKKWVTTEARQDLEAALDFIMEFCTRRLGDSPKDFLGKLRFGKRFLQALEADDDPAKPLLTYTAPSGLTLSESQLIAAVTLVQLERTAAAVVRDDATLVGTLLWDVHCLFLEMWAAVEDEIEEIDGTPLSKLGRKAALSRYQRDPKQVSKRFVYECWRAWQEHPEQYRSAAAFSRDMLDKHPETLTSEVVVSRWVRAWARNRD